MFLKPTLWILWIAAFPVVPVVSAACGEHRSLSACLAFRRQDLCAWDVATQRCVTAKGCEARGSPRECESELTTGATWDDTQNQCFWDLRMKQCRWSDECYAPGKEECLRAQCSWRKVCTPQDMVSRPGPNVCFETCRIPTADVSLMPHDTQRAERAMAPKRLGSSKVVHTSTGPVQGNQLPGVAEFLGIPFAQAPVEQRRWAPSEKMDTWNQVFQATEFSAACAQQSHYYAGSKKCQGLTRGKCLGYSEDCLTLNIWSPSARPASIAAPKAVLFWIHGGCYVSGSAADAEYNATELAQKQDVVVVSVQYRLGVFGFLGSPQIRSRDPKGSTGNYGLMDNIAALQWVQQNIAAFGGDPNRVTIFGESSGAGSVSLLLGVKESWPHYHGAIMESGTGSFWSYITLDAAQGNWQQVLNATKCSSKEADLGPDGPVACILSASSSVLTNAVELVPCRDGCTWAPVLDGVFLRGTPVQLAKAGLLRPNTPSISGFNKDDGAMFVTGYPISMMSMSQSSLDSYFSERYGEERKSQLQQLFPPPATGSWWISKYFEAAQACETDFSYSCTAMWISTWSSPSFVYKFSQPDSQGLTLHGDEIPYIFGTLESPSSTDLQVSQWMMKYWANFAKTGDPNGPGLPHWPSWQQPPASLLNISDQPVLAEAPNNSWPGCGFFLSNWDFYSLCLPGDVKRPVNLSQIMV